MTINDLTRFYLLIYKYIGVDLGDLFSLINLMLVMEFLFTCVESAVSFVNHDIDWYWTFYDSMIISANGPQARRPYLHQFEVHAIATAQKV